MKHLSPGRKAIIVYCALVIGSGVIALALMGPVLASAALIGSITVAALLAVLVYIKISHKEWNDAYQIQP